MGRLGCLLEAPGPPREARPPEALQGGGLGRLGLSLGSLRTSFGRLPGPQRHPKVAPGTGPAGDISHQPPTPKPNAHTANPFATSRSGLRYRWKPHFQGIVMTRNLLLQNAPPFGFKLGTFRGPKVHCEVKGAKRDKTKFGASFYLQTTTIQRRTPTNTHAQTHRTSFVSNAHLGSEMGPRRQKPPNKKLASVLCCF